MTDSKALIEQATRRAAILHASAAWGSDEDGALIDRLLDHIEKLEADNARLNDALRQAVIDAAEWARKAGEAQGKLEISEAAGILDGWMRDCERLRADNARLREALEEFVASTGVSDDPDALLVDALVYENAMRVLGLQK